MSYEFHEQLRYLNLRDGRMVPMVPQRRWSRVVPEDLVRTRVTQHPLEFVRYSFTGQPADVDPLTAVQELQHHHMSRGQADLPYNFLVGVDGLLYEGRGWFFRCDMADDADDYRDKTVSIAFMGDFKGREPPYYMLKVAMDLINFGVIRGWLSPYYQLLPVDK